MRKGITVLLIASALLCSCTQTPQKKAEKLVVNYLREKLHDPHSYEAISFSDIDTLFIKVGENEQCPEAIEYENKSKRCDNKKKQYLSILEAQSDTMSDEYRKSAIWQDKLAEAKIYLTSLIDSSQIYGEKAALAQLKYKLKGKFGGWKLVHKYKSQNATGDYILSEYQYILNKELTDITEVEELK